eukprot:SAG11_NODE_1249_length_5393_cov_4.349641_2_plen_151_part_00
MVRAGGADARVRRHTISYHIYLSATISNHLYTNRHTISNHIYTSRHTISLPYAAAHADDLRGAHSRIWRGSRNGTYLIGRQHLSGAGHRAHRARVAAARRSARSTASPRPPPRPSWPVAPCASRTRNTRALSASRSEKALGILGTAVWNQ